MQYSDFQNQPSSEKITIAILEATVRIVGWVVHSGFIYKLTNFDYSTIVAIEDSGNAYTSVGSIGAVTASKFFHDRANKTLYLLTTDSSNPNGRFLVLTFKLHFANVPIILPNDLASGPEVFFEPMVKSTSEFGVEIDTVAQTSEAIEGSGTLTLINDQDFWPANFDKVTFENQKCLLYSTHRDLDLSEMKLIFKGTVLKKTYAKDIITFQLQDQFAQLKATIDLPTIDAILGARVPGDLAKAYQRLLLGRVFGHRPTNVDQVVDGYPLTGTIAVTRASANMVGTSTEFLAELSPDDSIMINGQQYTIASVTDNLNATLTDPFADSTTSSISTVIIPSQPKRFINRIFSVAGHAVREPLTVISGESTIDHLRVNDTTDFYPGDLIYIGTLGSGEIAEVDAILGQKMLRLATSLATIPAIGTNVLRPAIQNVQIDMTPLTYYRDYTFDASTGILTLRTTAEKNAGQIFQLAGNAVLTNGSRAVTGSGFHEVIKPGFYFGVVGEAEFFEVLSVESDTALTLRTPATFSSSFTAGRYKSLIYDEGTTVLSLDSLGITSDGTKSGNLYKTAPAISKFLLTKAGLGPELNSGSFDDADEIAYQNVGMVVPVSYSDTNSLIYRDVLNKINKSVIGSLVQNGDFKFTYQVLSPTKPNGSTPKFSESDILSFNLNSTAENIVKTTIVQYKPREYSPLTQSDSINTQQKTSNRSTYILKTDTTKTIVTQLVDERDAEIMANRWSCILDSTIGILSFTTKMQGFTVQVGDIVEIEHRKFFERFGGTGKRKLTLVQGVKRSGSTVTIDATDLSNAFNRVSCINNLSNDWSSASESERLFGGYITDDYGLINNEVQSFDTNLIW